MQITTFPTPAPLTHHLMSQKANLYSDLTLKKKRFYLFLEREKEAEGEGEKHQCVVASQVPPIGDLAYNPGMCPDWE